MAFEEHEAADAADVMFGRVYAAAIAAGKTDAEADTVATAEADAALEAMFADIAEEG